MKKTKSVFYESPEVEVTEIKAGQLICQSDQDLLYGGFTNGEQEGF